MPGSRLTILALVVGLGLTIGSPPPLTAQGLEVIHSFTRDDYAQGWNPIELVAGDAGALYGATWYGGTNCRPYVWTSTCGVVFELLPPAAPQPIHELGYANHYEEVRLTWVDGQLYGAASRAPFNGHIFRLTPAAVPPWESEVVHTFGFWLPDPETGGLKPDGRFPRGPVFLAADGQLYGTAHQGTDPWGLGALYRLWPDGSGYELLHGFIPYDNSYAGIVATGAHPIGTLVQAPDGHIYGTAWVGAGDPSGWSLGYGTVFRFRGDTEEVERVHAFSTSSDTGYSPLSGLTLGPDGRIFGTTPSGAGAGGSVFEVQVSPEAGAEATVTALHVFTGAPDDGRYSNAELAWAPDGFLYGITGAGGLHDLGIVFRVRPDGTGYEILHSFAGSDGARPSSPLALGGDVALYGVTSLGGPGDGGVIYRVPLEPNGLVEGLAERIADLIDDGTLNDGQGGSLLQKLQQALDALEAGDLEKASTMLDAFINQVEAYKSAGLLDPNDADEMIAIAEAALASIAV